MQLTDSPTDNINIPPVKPGRRRRLSNDQKRALLNQGLSQYHSLSEVGRRYDIPVTLLFRWKRDLKIPLKFERAPQPPSAEVRLAELEARLTQLELSNRTLTERLQEVLEPSAIRANRKIIDKQTP